MLGNKLCIIFIGILSLFMSINAYCSYNYEKNKYPFLSDIIELYCAYYLHGPKSLEDLRNVTNDLLEAFPDELFYYDILDKYTFPKLMEISKDLEFRQTDCAFLLMYKNKILHKAIVFSPCCEDKLVYEEEKHILRIRKLMNSIYPFNQQNMALLLKDDLRAEMWEGLKEIYQDYTWHEGDIIPVEYKINSGIISYCKGTTINKSEPILKIENLLFEICDKYAMDRIIFYIPSVII